ncbi:MAG: aminotransferase class III-fold pyridoxal phosphate-dependent enzyme, partial [Congregibacter sp.]|nr:aminotransferase class III-fold pyridoxal phosphate-dependent enzyme [Congregibacter sp.]
AVLESLKEDQLQERAQPLGELIEKSFKQALRHKDAMQDFRRAGLMLGIELKQDCGALVAQALEAGILINVTAARTIRLLPPLIMTDAQGRQLGEGLANVVDEWLRTQQSLAGAAA